MAQIILHGDCLINRASELHQLFLHHLIETEKGVEIDLSAVGRCDLSFFQLICAAVRSFSEEDKYMRPLTPLPVTVAEQFEKAGFGPACEVCSYDDCFIKGTEMDCPVKRAKAPKDEKTQKV